jgi:phospholipase/carboxylesterase
VAQPRLTRLARLARLGCGNNPRVSFPTLALPIEWLPSQGRCEQLIVLLHGWGSNATALAPLAQALRAAFPQAAVLVPESPLAFDRDPDRLGNARQWYSIKGLITPEGAATSAEAQQLWQERVQALLPGLRDWLHAQQERLGVLPAATALGGFSQGAILAMALLMDGANDGIAGRVLAFGGRLVVQPSAAPRQTTLHLFHGADDTVVPAEGSRQALRWLAALQGDATLDVASGVGHELHPALIDCALHRLRTHIPLRTWQAAMAASSQAIPPVA